MHLRIVPVLRWKAPVQLARFPTPPRISNGLVSASIARIELQAKPLGLARYRADDGVDIHFIQLLRVEVFLAVLQIDPRLQEQLEELRA